MLKTLHEERGWSQAQLETGKKANPSLDVLKRLARALGVPVTELVE